MHHLVESPETRWDSAGVPPSLSHGASEFLGCGDFLPKVSTLYISHLYVLLVTYRTILPLVSSSFPCTLSPTLVRLGDTLHIPLIPLPSICSSPGCRLNRGTRTIGVLFIDIFSIEDAYIYYCIRSNKSVIEVVKAFFVQGPRFTPLVRSPPVHHT
jgi:hypothetical protein